MNPSTKNKKPRRLGVLRAIALVIVASMTGAAPAAPLTVHDAETGEPLPGVLVTRDGEVSTTGEDGVVEVAEGWSRLGLRAPGYSRLNMEARAEAGWPSIVMLKPFRPRGLYLSVHGIGSRKLRGEALEAVRRNDLNALVIDVKGDRGHIPFEVDLPLAREIGAQDLITVRDIGSLMRELKQQQLYLIARIVVFKDELLAAARPAWRVRTAAGADYVDNEGLRWVDPFQQRAWDYTLAIARIAAELGFDEIQFDYVRFPATDRAVYSRPADEASRTRAINAFLSAARAALVPYNVNLAADVFGYVLWNRTDTGVGQKIGPVTDIVDVVSPMLYPSGFHFGIPGHRNPVANSYQIVYKTLERGAERTGADPRRFRPWLQAFRDYAFDRREFGPRLMREQIRAAEDFGAAGWMFWNPRNVYPGNFTKPIAPARKTPTQRSEAAPEK